MGGGAAARVPAAPAAIGRFLVWKGASGRAYVFSRVDDRRDLDDAVTVAARLDGVAVRLLAAPAVGADGPTVAGEIWAHFLAEDAAARRRALADLIAGGRLPELFGAAMPMPAIAA